MADLTRKLPVNRRTLLPIELRGIDLDKVAHRRRGRDVGGRGRPVYTGALPDEYARVIREGHLCT